MQGYGRGNRGLRAALNLIGVAASIIAAVTGCSEPVDPTGEGQVSTDPNVPLSVYVANYPLQYFAERIGGEDVQVTLPVPAGSDPAFWKPTPEDIAAYQSADIILLNGASYSEWVSYSSLPLFRTVDTSASFSHQYIPFKNKGTHNHGPEGEHEHGKTAFTTWLDPRRAIAQAATIRDVLVRSRPGQAEGFNRRFDALSADLQELDDRLAAVFDAGGAQPLVFSHPVYQYLIRGYGIDARSVHWEPDGTPTPGQWQELEQILADHPARWMIWEGRPNPSTVEELKRRGLGSITFDPCANVPEEGDYLSVMRDNVRQLAETLEP